MKSALVALILAMVCGLAGPATAAVAMSSAGNVAQGDYSSISGGVQCQASGEGASVSGGLGNAATARWATVSGGADRTSSGEADWRAGTLFENFQATI